MTNQIVIMELPCHILVIATSYDVKILWHFCPTWHIYSNSSTWFCDVFWYWLWQKWASQISDDRIIVTRFMTKKYIFVAEDLLWHGIGDKTNFRHASVTDYERWRKYHFQWHKWNVAEAHICCSESRIAK